MRRRLLPWRGLVGMMVSALGLMALPGSALAQSAQAIFLPPVRTTTPQPIQAPAPSSVSPPATDPAPVAPPEQSRDLSQRVGELEETIRRLEARPPACSTPDQAPGSAKTSTASEPPPTWLGIPLSSGTLLERDLMAPSSGETGDQTGQLAGWHNGFFLRSADNSYVLRITGQVQADDRVFLNDRDQTDISTFLVRRARLGIDATVFKYFEFRLLPDFGQNLPGTPYTPAIQDAYINVHYFDEFQLAAGKLKQPVSYEQLVQDRFVPTVERSLIDQLVPARDVGVLIHGYNLLDNKLAYAFGVFNGGINGNVDTNGFKDLAWRAAVRPLNWEQLPAFMHLLQLGISGTTGIEVEPISPNVLRTPLTVPFLTFNSTVQADGLRERWTPELSYFYKGLGLASQLYWETQQMSPSPALSNKTIVTVPFKGYYLMGTYLLTGETRTEYSKPVVPLKPFDALHPFVNPGAWELVARYSFLEVGDVVFAKGAANLADPSKNANRASELTLGYNWYLNAWVRMQFNWEHAWFATGVPLGAPSLLRFQDTVVARFQVIF